MILSVDAAVLDLFPRARVAVLVCHRLDNHLGRGDADAAVDRLRLEATRDLYGGPPGAHPHVAAWRAAYRAFGSDPRAHAISSEALLKRFRKAHELPRISPVVDVYNWVSLHHLLPLGGYDLDALTGDVVLTRARGGEEFEPLGRQAEIERVDPGEVVYRDPARVLTRRWNHRDSRASAITPGTGRAVFLCEAPDETIPDHALTTAVAELRHHLEALGGDAFTTATLHARHPAVEL